MSADAAGIEECATFGWQAPGKGAQYPRQYTLRGILGAKYLKPPPEAD